MKNTRAILMIVTVVLSFSHLFAQSESRIEIGAGFESGQSATANNALLMMNGRLLNGILGNSVWMSSLAEKPFFSGPAVNIAVTREDAPWAGRFFIHGANMKAPSSELFFLSNTSAGSGPSSITVQSNTLERYSGNTLGVADIGYMADIFALRDMSPALEKLGIRIGGQLHGEQAKFLNNQNLTATTATISGTTTVTPPRIDLISPESIKNAEASLQVVGGLSYRINLGSQTALEVSDTYFYGKGIGSYSDDSLGWLTLGGFSMPQQVELKGTTHLTQSGSVLQVGLIQSISKGAYVRVEYGLRVASSSIDKSDIKNPQAITLVLIPMMMPGAYVAPGAILGAIMDPIGKQPASTGQMHYMSVGFQFAM